MVKIVFKSPSLTASVLGTIVIGKTLFVELTYIYQNTILSHGYTLENVNSIWPDIEFR